MPLTDAKCRAPNKTGKREKRSDGGGLRLVVSATGRANWELAFRWEGKAQTMSLGPYPTVGLAAARIRREEARLALQAGRNPAAPEPEAEGPTFHEAAKEWIAAQGGRWSESTKQTSVSRLERDVYPAIGEMQLAAITTADVLAIVRAIEGRGAFDVSRRVAAMIAKIFDRARIDGHVTTNPATNLHAAFAPRPRVVHHNRLRAADMGDFLSKLAGYDGDRLTAIALETTIRTATRTGEIRFATWREIEKDLWRIPGERMKMGTEHLVPLSEHVRFLLKQAMALGKGSELIFPGVDGKPMSANTLLYACYRLGYHGRVTTHGFRSTFSTWCNEQGRWHPDAIERQLAHFERNEVRGAYNSAEYLPARREMMVAWNEFLSDEALTALL